MPKGRRTERLQIMLEEAELRAIEQWRFDHRMPSRAAAVREMLRRGLDADGYGAADLGAKTSDFGVVDEPPPDAVVEE